MIGNTSSEQLTDKSYSSTGSNSNLAFQSTWFLYELNSLEFNRRLEGLWQLISVQSIITWVEEYLSLKLSGIVALTTSLLGHIDT